MTPVPSTRLLWCVAALIPAAAIAGPLPELWPLCVLALVAIGALAALDLWRSMRSAPLPTVEAPPIARLSKDREAKITLVLVNPSGAARQLRFALALPGSFASQEADLTVALPAGVPRLLVTWTCTGKRRGRFASGPACLEVPSVMGLWQLRRQQPLPMELRVYPNLFSERRQLAALFLNRGQTGVRLRRLVGRGRDFERLREYQPGDSFDEVHWKGTAKRGRPITKVFQVERTQEIYVIVDASRLSARPVEIDGKTVTTLERYLTAALVLLMAAGRQGDRFGLLVYDSRVRTFLRAANGTTHYGACREAVHAMEPSADTPDFAEVFSFLRTRLQRRALLFFLTDLSDPVVAEQFVAQVGVLSRQHLVLVNQLKSPGVEPLFTRPVTQAGDIPARLAGHYQWREVRDTAGRLQPLGVTAMLLGNERLAAGLVEQYLQVKGRQAL